MELHFQNPGFDYMLEQILAFQDEDASPFWSAPLYRFYPQLEPARTLPRPARLEAIARELRSVYAAQEQTIHEKTRAYAAHWQRCKPQVTAALSDAFSLDAAGLFNDLQVCLSLNPIEPRCLREHRFDLFYLNSPQGAVGAALHEIIHFFYFYVWNGLFDDPPTPGRRRAALAAERDGRRADYARRAPALDQPVFRARKRRLRLPVFLRYDARRPPAARYLIRNVPRAAHRRLYAGKLRLSPSARRRRPAPISAARSRRRRNMP